MTLVRFSSAAVAAACLLPHLAHAEERPPAALPTHTTDPSPAPSATPRARDTTNDNADKSDPGPHAGYKGFSFGFPAGGGPTLGGNYFLSDRMAVKLDLGIDLGKETGNDDFLYGFSVEGGLRVYVAKAGHLHPFVQPGLFWRKRRAAATSGIFWPSKPTPALALSTSSPIT